jgi:hypothetical protein
VTLSSAEQVEETSQLFMAVGRAAFRHLDRADFA